MDRQGQVERQGFSPGVSPALDRRRLRDHSTYPTYITSPTYITYPTYITHTTRRTPDRHPDFPRWVAP
jgi:hypothetical protein